MTSLKIQLLPRLEETVYQLSGEFDQIPAARKELLTKLTGFIKLGRENNLLLNLNFICTHNSRRSHISQLWAQAAAYYYGVHNVRCYSGGTEATAFNPRAVRAVSDAGFEISIIEPGNNPRYEVRYSQQAEPLTVFSKRYDDAVDSNNSFVAVMTCSHADENCPVVTGAVGRVALTYDDPKDFDDTPLEEVKYRERVHEIGREILYAFSRVAADANRMG